MVDLLDKHKALQERVQRIAGTGTSGLSVTNEKMISPTRAIVGNREIILAGTNNYMGITFDPRCIAAGKRALDEFGTGTTGSRIANGSFALHTRLEETLADFLGLEHCIIFTTGYQANLGMLSGLAGPKDTIYLDSDSHSSIYDGCTLSGAKLVRFRHNDAADLDKRLSRSEGEEGGRLVVLEGIYSMLGDRAPLQDFVDLKKKHDFQLCVDDAHSFGVLGPNGRGLGDESGLSEHVDFVIGTFSKSVGAIGGFGASNHPMFNTLRYAMRPYMFTASASPASIATSIEAIKILKAEPERRAKLWANSERLYHGLKGLGFDMGCDVVSPVVAVKMPDEATTIAKWNELFDGGVYVNMALPPGTPNRLCLLRCSVSAGHTTEEIDEIIATFKRVFGK